MSRKTVRETASVPGPKIPAGLESKLARLQQVLIDLDSMVVAYSGGVDSSFLLKVAVDLLGDKVLAVTGDSESIPRSELDSACRLAESIGARHRIVKTEEMDDPEYVANGPDRCFHCKKTLFGALTKLAREEGFNVVVEGSNQDDLSDYRPGMKAVEQFQVRSPLREAELSKEEIRSLSRLYNLPTWEKPAAPCLSSRIPYGLPVTSEKLKRIELAEAYLRSLGLSVLRVRDHDDVARIEVPSEAFSTLIEGSRSKEISEKLRSFGYRFVTLDLSGFRSGSLNEILKDL